MAKVKVRDLSQVEIEFIRDSDDKNPYTLAAKLNRSAEELAVLMARQPHSTFEQDGGVTHGGGAGDYPGFDQNKFLAKYADTVQPVFQSKRSRSRRTV